MLQAVITALPLLILEIDEDGYIIGYNSDSPSRFDVHPESFLNRHLSSYFPDKVTDDLHLVFSAIKNGEQPPSINYAMNLGDGEHWFEARFISSSRKHSIVVIQDVTRYKINEAKIQKQLDQMSALRAIDQAITSSVDLNLTLSILLTQLVKHLQIDAACILLWNSDAERFEYKAGVGFRTNSLSHTKLRLGEGYAGIAALEQRVIQKLNLINDGTDFLQREIGVDEFVPVGQLHQNTVKGLDVEIEKAQGQFVCLFPSLGIGQAAHPVYESLLIRINVRGFVENIAHGKTRPPPECPVSLCIFFLIGSKAFKKSLHSSSFVRVPGEDLHFHLAEMASTIALVVVTHPKSASTFQIVAC